MDALRDPADEERRGRATLRDVAALAGTTPMTVSNVVNGRAGQVGPEVAKRVRAACERLGYRPHANARRLRTNRRQAIGVVIVDHGSRRADSNAMFCELVRQFECSAGFRIVEPAKGSSWEGEAKTAPLETAEKTKTKEVPESKGKEQPRPAEKESGSASKTEVAQPSPAKIPAAAKAKYTLQIAALNSSDEAKELVSKLKSKGYDAYAVTGTAAAKGALHRVRIGSFSSLQEARQFAVDFEKKEKIKTIITSP